MPGFGTKRFNNTATGLNASSRRLSVGKRSAARFANAVLLSALGFAALPLAFAQHGGSGHESAPHTSQPHMSAPRSAPAQAPRTANHPPAGRSTYPGGVPTRANPTPVPPGPPASYRPGQGYPAQRGPYATPGSSANGQHLGSWLQHHQGESFTGQENALRREPGFNRLPQPQQQRLIDRLHQLNTMPPQQRQRTLGRIENMERLSPERREAVRNSAQEMNSMNPARKEQMRAAWRVLRDMPPAQREHVLNSPAYRSMYSDHERQVLGNLLSIEPYQPR